MPTSWDTDAAVEEIYSLLELLIHAAERMKAVSLFGGDFNASIGAPKGGDDLTLIGACGNEARNRRGARMIHPLVRSQRQNTAAFSQVTRFYHTTLPGDKRMPSMQLANVDQRRVVS